MKTSQLVLALGLAAALAAPAAARDQIRIVGSSTVYPFSTAVAEQFGRTSGFKTPVVESTGTGGGVKLFCAGVGDQTPDIANASRRMKDTELAACQAAGVKEIIEVKIGYDGIVIANSTKAKPIALKLLYSPETGAVLGAQAVGPDGADKRIDVLATAIRAGMTVDDVADLELCYAPPYGSAKDPVNLAGMAAQNARAGLVESVHWHELAGFDPAESLVLDVRDAKERDGGAIPGSVHIPLGELRHRLAELPKDKLILAHCASGQRSYNACRLLSQHGFRCRNLSGSYKTWVAGAAAKLPL